MKKMLILVLLCLLATTAFAGNVFIERVKGVHGTGDILYIREDTNVEKTGRFPIFNARVREFYAERKDEYTTTGDGHLIIQGKDSEDNGLRLSVSFDKKAEILENTADRLYVKTSGRIIYSKVGEGTTIANTDTIRWDYNKVTGLINVAGGEDTDYKFRVHNIEAK